MKIIARFSRSFFVFPTICCIFARDKARGDRQAGGPHEAAWRRHIPYRMNKKVFHIVSHFDVGGAERVAVNIAKSQTEGFEYHVVELVRGHSPFTRTFVNELREAGIRYHRWIVPDVHCHYLFQRLAVVLFPVWFLPLFIRQRPAVIHSHTEMPDMAVWWFFTLFPWFLRRCKIVRTVHNTRLWTGLKETGRTVEAFFNAHDANVSISPSVQQSYLNEYGRRTPIIYNGVAETPQRRYEGLAEGKVNVLFAGRLEPQKGVSTLIEIVKRAAAGGRFHFHIIGDGSLRADVEREVGGLPCVTLRPPVSGIAAFLASFDYLLMPSEFEGLSIMSIEASLAGLPVIANTCPGLSDTLPDDWPLSVSRNDIGQYMAIFSAIGCRRADDSLGRKAAAFAREKFGIRRMQEAYEAFYNY